MNFGNFSSNTSLLFTGQLISQVCDKMMSIGVIWIITDRFGSKWIPIYVLAATLPHLLLSPVAGRCVGKWGALRTVIAMDFLRSLIHFACAFVVYIFAAESNLMPILVGTAFLSGMGSALFNPAILTLPIQIETRERSQRLTALIDSCFSMGNVLGPVFSVLIYASGGLLALLLLNAVSYLLAGVLGLRIQLPSGIQECTPPASDPLRESSVAFLRRYPTVTGMLFCFALLNLFFAPIQLFIPWFAKNIYSDGISGLAKLELAIGVGTIAGGLFLAWKKLPGHFFMQTLGILAFICIFYLSFVSSSSILVGGISLLIMGVFVGMANVHLISFFQTHPKAADVPHIMNGVNLISVATIPVSMALVGVFIREETMRDFARVCGFSALILLPVLFFVPGIRRV